MTADSFFRGKTALITGASSGIGRATALALGRAGARVAILARRADKLEALRDELGPQVPTLPLVVDVTEADACRDAVARVAETWGGLDLLINNAGISMNARFDDADLGVFHQMMDVNYFGSLYMARFAQPWLARSRGHVIFVTSVVGKRGFPTRSGYSAAKFAVHGLFETLRVEWADTGIHVGLVAPGYVDTNIREKALGEAGTPREKKGFTRGHVMTAEECAEEILTAARRRQRERVLSAGGRFMVALNHLLPGVADRIAKHATA